MLRETLVTLAVELGLIQAIGFLNQKRIIFEKHDFFHQRVLEAAEISKKRC